jgi:guanylate kinase
LSKEFSRYGILFVVSAPSGAGKSTLCDALRQTPDFVYSVSCTTRPPRAGEIDGEDYHFLSRPDFLERVKAGEFLEQAEVHGKYYGTLREPILSNLHKGVDVLIDIDTQGAAAIRQFDDRFCAPGAGRRFHYAAGPRGAAPPLDQTRHRNSRANRARLQTAAREMEHWRDYRYTIISRSVEEDLLKFRHIMGAERYLSDRMILA